MSPQLQRPGLGRAYVRILGKQLGRFIEFEFILNDKDLCVELVMPEAAFAEFCAANNAEILPSPEAGGEVVPFPERSAGLYRPPEDD